MTKENKLAVAIEQSADGKIIFKLSGAINESFAPFAAQLATKFPKMAFVEFNLEGITMINSSGTREWTKLIVNSKNLDITLTHCPKVFIDQVNMVDGFLSKSCRVMSFYVPYFNDNISQEDQMLYQYGVHYTDHDVKIEQVYRNQVGISFNLDVIESKYFRFITNKNLAAV